MQTRGGQLSYLVSEETVSGLPLNGRNYTDLAFLQPGVLSFPHRDGGSIVAHGLAAASTARTRARTCTCSTAR